MVSLQADITTPDEDDGKSQCRSPHVIAVTTETTRPGSSFMQNEQNMTLSIQYAMSKEDNKEHNHASDKRK